MSISAEKLDKDIIICPNCGNKLTYIDGIQKCTFCEYELSVSEINYSRQHSNLCMICSSLLNEDELQICAKCKELMIKNQQRVKEESKNGGN